MPSRQNTYTYLLLLSIALISFSSCSKRAQCPAYMDASQGTLSLQDTESMTPQEVQKQSQKLLNSQDYYIQVKRSKRTGLVKKRKKVKKGKNITKKHKGFKTDPRTLKGIK